MEAKLWTRIGAMTLVGVACVTLAAESSADKTCPTGRFKTTGKWKGCDCPKKSKKDYSGAFKSHAECKGAPKPACPNGSFKTTGKWHGCKCSSGEHKHWLDPFKYEGKCVAGKSPKEKCQDKGRVWIGANNSVGQCVDSSVGDRILKGLDPRVTAYQSYFKAIGAGVKLHSLHSRWRSELQAFYSHSLTSVRFGVSKPLGSTAITDCKTIYWPEGTGIVAKLADGSDLSKDELRWALHELAHTEQCDEAGGRNEYAYMWFKEMSATTLSEIAQHIAQPEKISHRTIHDRMPMEKVADKKAADVADGVDDA
jgi:hypothetical protein